jgi:cellobiose phosphorylase
MQYGYFNDEAREYIVTTPFTPIKWCNYVGTLQFGGIVDNTGGALICKGDPSLNRITKYIAQMPAADFKGSTVYIRIKNAQGQGYEVYSPFYTPTLKKLDRFECHVGLSYSTFVAEYQGIRSEITYFVPTGSSVMLQDIRVTNTRQESCQIDVIPLIEFTHFDALKQLTNADWVPQTMTLKAHNDGPFKILEQYAYMKRDTAVNYFTANQPVSSFEGNRKLFLGNNEYGSFAAPLALQDEELKCGECVRGDNIGALMIHFGELGPGETRRVITQLGQEQSLHKARPSIEKYRSEQEVDAAFAELKSFWDRYLDTVQVVTPSAAFNSMVNVHNPRQCHTTKNWSRYLSLYQLGYGSRGIGFRDSSQDLLGVMTHMPQEAIELALKLLAVQKRNGSAMHQFNPLNMVATIGDAHEMEDRPDYYGDDHLWIILTVCNYIKETGDIKFLDRMVPFYEKDKNDQPLESATVWEHLVRAIEFTWSDRGQHGLPLLGFADWNDTVNLPKGAESFMIAGLFGKAVQYLLPICDAYQQPAFKEKIIGYYNTLKENVEKVGWDGEWYLRYFDDKGQPIGSHQNDKGKVWANGQSWPIMAGYSSEEHRQKALTSVNKYLNTKYGIKLSTPGYEGYDPQIGGVTTYPPGAKENGGIFLHANPWIMIAETLDGNGNRAFEYYNQINPAAKNDILDIFESEPYCYPQNILGDEHPQFGLGRNAWLSGTAAWTYVAATQHILGIQAEWDGLIINPCIPSHWDGFRMVRKFRGATYNINVKNPHGKNRGVSRLIVDGKELKGNKAPVFTSGEHAVEVVIGE